MIRAAVAFAAIALGASAVLAQDPIAARKGVMKEVGGQARVAGQMTRAEIPYDQSKAQAIFATFIEASQKMPGLFPENSKTGDTTASPRIWENMADFRARFEKLGNDAKDAQAATKDLETFKVSYANVSRNCGGCHETYRIKKN